MPTIYPVLPAYIIYVLLGSAATHTPFKYYILYNRSDEEQCQVTHERERNEQLSRDAKPTFH